MRTFLSKVVLFSVVMAVVFAANAVVNLFMFRNGSLPFSEPSVLIVGDSHLAKGLDAGQLPSTINISQAFEPYPLMYWKLAYVLDRMIPDTVIIGFTHHHLSTFNDIKFSDDRYADEVLGRSYIIGRFDRMGGVEVDRLVLMRKWFRRMCLFPQQHLDLFITRFNNDKRSDVSSPEKPMKRHFGEDNGYEFSPICRAFLDSMVNICRINGVVPILAASPVHHSYLAAVPERFISAYEKAKDEMVERGVTVVDLTAHPLPDSCFLDTDHLNIHGAAAFKELLWSELNSPLP